MNIEKFSKSFFALTWWVLLCVMSSQSFSQDARIKDISNIRGFRSNQLTGFGIVTGLNGTGDSPASLVSNQAVNNMLMRMGIKPDGEVQIPASMAAVLVTGELSPFARVGDQLDVKLSSVGDAKSLAGGTLIMTTLKAGDGNVYAVAQGTVVIAQQTGAGAGVLTVARVPQGGVVEREFLPNVGSQGKIQLSLKQADYTTNFRMTEVINTELKGFFAKAVDAASTEVVIPMLYQEKIPEFISLIENLRVQTDQKSAVVINERTGTVVMGADVMISPVAISHGQLSISIGGSETKDKSKTDKASIANVQGSTVGELVQSLNSMGVKPADLVSIMQTVHAAGALKAELKFL